ncbi:adiponectin receptor 1, isoform CRA_b [Rattus norvegicus]|uniref:Adiponectin receptor 1, isoform CRA_b n=1 Tax=Rattus norvegicus TaxID=10116 RepID=A6ICC0_RAT|nr:adiponectin receptor 1, isoform CRA_b [Rattus norvegicus]
MTPFSEPSHLRVGGGTSQVLLKITSLLKYEEESELSVSRRNLLENRTSDPSAHWHSLRAVHFPCAFLAVTSARQLLVLHRQDVGAHVEILPIPSAILGKKL